MGTGSGPAQRRGRVSRSGLAGGIRLLGFVRLASFAGDLVALKLVAVFGQPGDRVEKGQRLAIVEAMKMEHVLVASSDAEVAEIAAEPGTQVAEGARLIVLKTEG